MSTAHADKKRCPRCKRLKRRGLFSPDKNTSSGLTSWCRSCIRNRSKEMYCPDVQRERWLQHQYGITIHTYESMLREQSGRCAICTTMVGKSKRLAVDHCHDTGNVRGLLCDPCNRALGRFGDNLEGIYKVVRYLEDSG